MCLYSNRGPGHTGGKHQLGKEEVILAFTPSCSISLKKNRKLWCPANCKPCPLTLAWGKQKKHDSGGSCVGGSHSTCPYAELGWKQRFRPKIMEQTFSRQRLGSVNHNIEAYSIQRTKQQPRLSFAEVYQNDRVEGWYILLAAGQETLSICTKYYLPLKKCT